MRTINQADSPLLSVSAQSSFCDMADGRRFGVDLMALLPQAERLGRMTFAAIASSTNCHVSSADCPWRDDERGSGCGAYFADLPLRRPPDIPARKRLRVISGGKG